jgi:hypothetical protein
VHRLSVPLACRLAIHSLPPPWADAITADATSGPPASQNLVRQPPGIPRRVLVAPVPLIRATGSDEKRHALREYRAASVCHPRWQVRDAPADRGLRMRGSRDDISTPRRQTALMAGKTHGGEKTPTSSIRLHNKRIRLGESHLFALPTAETRSPDRQSMRDLLLVALTMVQTGWTMQRSRPFSTELNNHRLSTGREAVLDTTVSFRERQKCRCTTLTASGGLRS